MLVIPAIDLKEGKCVRLEQGLMDKDTVFNDNPAAQALEWQNQGAELLHIVDLDGAFAGEPKNRGAIEAIVNALAIPAQLGGGIRDMATIESYLSLGLSRVIIGTAAQRNPELVREACEKFPGRIVVGIDAKSGMVAVQGWAEVTGVTAVELAKKFEGSAFRQSFIPISAAMECCRGRILRLPERWRNRFPFLLLRRAVFLRSRISRI